MSGPRLLHCWRLWLKTGVRIRSKHAFLLLFFSPPFAPPPRCLDVAFIVRDGMPGPMQGPGDATAARPRHAVEWGSHGFFPFSQAVLGILTALKVSLASAGLGFSSSRSGRVHVACETRVAHGFEGPVANRMLRGPTLGGRWVRRAERQGILTLPSVPETESYAWTSSDSTCMSMKAVAGSPWADRPTEGSSSISWLSATESGLVSRRRRDSRAPTLRRDWLEKGASQVGGPARVRGASERVRLGPEMPGKGMPLAGESIREAEAGVEES